MKGIILLLFQGKSYFLKSVNKKCLNLRIQIYYITVD